jgi:GNAT superfamily N-acetyltransferase
MNPPYSYPNPFSHVATIGHGPEKPGVCVKEFTARHHHALQTHFLTLDGGARLLRFGMVFPDELITRYVQGINFARDTLFGVYDSDLMLAGVGHLAFTPREQALPVLARSTSKERIGEFGVSVSASARGMGIGTRLFERAAIHCRNADVDILYMQFLSCNESMIHIAQKFGMEVQKHYGEADAYLKLRPANPASASQEVVEEQFASLDYTLKLETRLRSLIEAEARYRALLETTSAITYMADLTDPVKDALCQPTHRTLAWLQRAGMVDGSRTLGKATASDRLRSRPGCV